jgi:hypothetical protein
MFAPSGGTGGMRVCYAESPVTLKDSTAISNTTNRKIYIIADNSVTSNVNIFYRDALVSTIAGTASGSTANITTDADGYTLGAVRTSSVFTYFTGYIYELIIVLSLPSQSERRRIEAYLANKWGIRPEVGHPYEKITP